MRRSSMFPRSSLRRTPPDLRIDATGLAETARGLASALPGLAKQAEAGGLQLVAQHLNKALQLAQRVATSDSDPSASRS